MIDIYADGASLEGILELDKNPLIKGFTTNPALMKKAGITNYRNFAFEVLYHIKNKPVSFEVIADDLETMYKQAIIISSWANNVFVKIPVVLSNGTPTYELIEKLASDKVQLNITCVFTEQQAVNVSDALGDNNSIISVFAGRIADTLVSPIPTLKIVRDYIDIYHPMQKLLYASTREILNIKEAEEVGCHIITVPHDLLKKMNTIGKDLTEFSKETSLMFYQDAVSSGLSL